MLLSYVVACSKCAAGLQSVKKMPPRAAPLVGVPSGKGPTGSLFLSVRKKKETENRDVSGGVVDLLS
jgi:hypothetical protein